MSKNENHINDFFTDYFQNKEITDFTYGESLSYRIAVNKQNCNEPYLMRRSLRNTFIENTKNIELTETPVNKARISKIKSNASNSRKMMQTNDRILRSQANISFKRNNRSSVPFVKEHTFLKDYDDDIQKSYRYGMLNTNTNNSGPDDLEEKRSRKMNFFNHDISGDEGLGSDYVDSEIKAETYGSNNANNRSQLHQKFRVSNNQWIQKNMFGLPTEESDEIINQDLSGAISGDEQYEIYSRSDSHKKSKGYKTYSGRSHKNELNNSSKRFDNILCSPMAILSFLFEFVWHLITSVTKYFVYQSRRISYSFIRSIGIILSSTIRIFNIPSRHSLPFKSQLRNKSMRDHFRNLLALVLLLTAILLFWKLFFIYKSETSDAQLSYFSHFNISNYAYRLAGNDCMTRNDCCRTEFEIIRRFVFCLFSLPARMILSSDVEYEKSAKLFSTANISNLEEILENIKQQLENHDKKLMKYDLKINNIEKYQPMKKFSDLTRNINEVSGKLLLIRSEVDKIKQTETVTGSNLHSQKENPESISLNIEKIEKRLEKKMKLLYETINKTDEQSTTNSEKINDLKTLMDQLQIDIKNFQEMLSEVNKKTVHLEQSHQNLIENNIKFKKEILDEISDEVRNFHFLKDNFTANFNFEMSKLEKIMNENQVKFSKENQNKLIATHLENMKENLKSEINSTVWNNVENIIRTMIQSNGMNLDQLKEKSVSSRNSWNCLPSYFRSSKSSTMCLRLHQVRKLLINALNMFAADKIGMADFALESAGGTIATTRCTETFTDRASILTIFGIPLLRLTNSPRVILQPSTNPGECWPMKGYKGSVVVQLSAKVNITAVTIDHIPKSISPSESIDSVIKDFEIKALSSEADMTGKSLGNYTYQIDSNPVQTFYIQDPTESKFIELIVNSNYGNKEYTCIYRFRVHGKLIQN